MLAKVLYTACLLAALLTVSAAVESEKGYLGITEYFRGDLPILFTCGHGGKKDFPQLASLRKDGSRGGGDNSRSTTLALVDRITKIMGGRKPYVVLNHARKSMFRSNEFSERKASWSTALNATSPKALKAYQSWTNLIKKARNEINQRFGDGFMFDMHGQTHKQRWVEFGYVVKGRKMRLSPEKFHMTTRKNGKKRLRRTTMARLAAKYETAEGFTNAHRGPNSIGGLMMLRGWKSVPSPAYHGPKKGEGYFSGGGNAFLHGARTKTSKKINTAQIESPNSYMNRRRRTKYVEGLSDAILHFMNVHFDLKLPAEFMKHSKALQSMAVYRTKCDESKSTLLNTTKSVDTEELLALCKKTPTCKFIAQDFGKFRGHLFSKCEKVEARGWNIFAMDAKAAAVAVKGVSLPNSDFKMPRAKVEPARPKGFVPTPDADTEDEKKTEETKFNPETEEVELDEDDTIEDIIEESGVNVEQEFDIKEDDEDSEDTSAASTDDMDSGMASEDEESEDADTASTDDIDGGMAGDEQQQAGPSRVSRAPANSKAAYGGKAVESC